MTNHNPTITSGAATGSFSEDANTTGSTVDHVLSGTMNFTDSDHSDTHATTTALKTAVWSGGSTLPSGALTKFQAGLTSSIQSDSNGSGKLKWNFSEDDRDFDFLAKGETLVLTYEITLKDNHGGSTKQTVKITVTGTDDKPVFATTTGATLSEQANHTLSLSPDTAHIALQFTDVDLNNTGHKAELLSVSATGNTSGILPGSLGTAELKSFFDIDNVVKNAGSSNGVVNTTFSAPDLAFDYLAAGEQIKITYVVQIDDQKGGISTQNVVVTVNGTNDKPFYICGPQCAQLAEDTNVSPSGNLIASGDLLFTDLDLSDTHTITTTVVATSSNGDPVPLTTAQLLAAFHTTNHDSTGHLLGDVEWDFAIDNDDVQYLNNGETLTLTYTIKLADPSGGFDTQTVTIKIDGKSDLVVNPATATVTDSVAADVDQVVAAGNAIIDSGDHGSDPSVVLSVTAVNGQAAAVGTPVAGAYGTLNIDSTGFYQYTANANIDPLQVGDHVTDQFTIEVTDSEGNVASKTLTFNIDGGDDAPVITSATALGTVTEDAGPTVTVNGSFETGNLSGWTTAGPGTITAEFLGTGGQYGDYAAKLGATAITSTLSQDMGTTAGQHYTLTFSIFGDPESSDNHVTVSWGGVTVLTLDDVTAGGFTTYSFEVIGNAGSTALEFAYTDDGVGLFVDGVSVNALTGPAAETTGGSISFSDIETADTHTASFTPFDSGYVGTFSLDPVSEGGSTGSVAWHFNVDNADIQFLGAGETLVQTYQVSVTDNHGASALQNVTVAINGANDAPTAVGADHVITNADTAGGIFLPNWVLTVNDTDPDAHDTLKVDSATAGPGTDFVAVFSTGVIWVDDGTLGGSFDYKTTDGMAVSPGSGTVTVVNNTAATATLAGGSGADIIVSAQNGTALSGGGGNDILIGNGGSHVLIGGSGDDIFAFQLVPDQGVVPSNSITDFNNTTDNDMIAIAANAFGGGLTVGMDAATVFESSADDQFVSDTNRFHYDETADVLYFSADGTSASAIVVAKLQTGVLLHGNDLMIV